MIEATIYDASKTNYMSSRWYELTDFCNEQWKPVVGYEENYKISNFGRLKSLRRNGTVANDRIMKPKKTWDGYLEYTLFKNDTRKYVRGHIIVATAFIKNPDNKPQVNHEDGNKINNAVDNLSWSTISENIQHAYRTGLNRKRFGADNDKSLAIEQYTLDGNYIKTWGSSREIQRVTGINHANVLACCRGRCVKSHGFIWKYAKGDGVNETYFS